MIFPLKYTSVEEKLEIEIALIQTILLSHRGSDYNPFNYESGGSGSNTGQEAGDISRCSNPRALRYIQRPIKLRSSVYSISRHIGT